MNDGTISTRTDTAFVRTEGVPAGDGLGGHAERITADIYRIHASSLRVERARRDTRSDTLGLVGT